MLLITAFKSENLEEGPWLVMKFAHNQDLNEHTSAARDTRLGKLRGQILLKVSLGGPIEANRIYMTMWIPEVTGTEFPSNSLWMNGILGVFEWV